MYLKILLKSIPNLLYNNTLQKQKVDLELNGESIDLLWLGGEGFQDIPSWAYVYLVTTLKVPPENLTGLRSVQRRGFWDGKLVSFIRIYDPNTSEESSLVKDFTSLDRHPELVLYEGYIEKGSNRVFLQSSSTKDRQHNRYP